MGRVVGTQVGSALCEVCQEGLEEVMSHKKYLGVNEGELVGMQVGKTVGSVDGDLVGITVGMNVGKSDGVQLGLVLK